LRVAIWRQAAWGSAASHGCSPQGRPLFGLWNANRDGAPNHRCTTRMEYLRPDARPRMDLRGRRYFNLWTSKHFYTSSADEAFTVQQNYPQFVDEGPRWAVYPTQVDPAAP
jgi:hypothetical protein